MAKVSNIPEADHVLRYARRRHLKCETDSKGEPVAIHGCFPDLFKLRNSPEFIRKHCEPETALSVNWIEFFDGDAEERLQQTVKDFRSGWKINKFDAFAKLNVGEFKRVCKKHSAKVRIIPDAKKSTIKSHSSITQLPQDNAMLFNDLCSLAFDSLIPAKKFLD